MRGAAELVTRITPTGMTRTAADELVARLNGNYNQRTQAAFRGVIRSDASEQGRADHVAELADEFGLQPAPPPQPLPAIHLDDVHLVCWPAVSNADGLGEPFFSALVGEEQGTLVLSGGVEEPPGPGACIRSRNTHRSLDWEHLMATRDRGPATESRRASRRRSRMTELPPPLPPEQQPSFDGETTPETIESSQRALINTMRRLHPGTDWVIVRD